MMDVEDCMVEDEVAFRISSIFEGGGNIDARQILRVAREADLRGWVKRRVLERKHIIFDMRLEGKSADLLRFTAFIAGHSELQSVFWVKMKAAGYTDVSILRDPLESDQEAQPAILHFNDAARKMTESVSAAVVQQTDWLLRSGSIDKGAVRHILEAQPVELLPEAMRKKFKGIKSNAETSFSAEMWAQTYLRDIHNRLFRDKLEFILESKAPGLIFADSLGLKTPKVLFEATPAAELEFSENLVVKPQSGGGSHGVYIVKTFAEIIDVRRSKILSSLGELQDSMRDDLVSGAVRKDLWFFEGYLTGKHDDVPRDLKFYTFYGECPLVLEIDRNKNKTRYCWWDENGDVMPTGKYEGELFRGDGFDKNLLDIAKATSLRIPAPFIRIDFLNANPQPVLGEFTPRPGNFHRFDVSTDRWLGRIFVEARARLFNDLRNGKCFKEFDALKTC